MTATDVPRCALVTGGTSGIGRGVAGALLAAGYRVAVCGRDVDRCAQVAAEFAAEFGDAVQAAPADTTDADQLAAVVDRLVDAWGRLDALVTAAGVLARGSLDTLTVADFEQALRTNVLGTWLAVRAAAVPMRAQQHGRVVTIGSVLGTVGAVERAGYSATKGAVHALTRSLALELAGTGITVNCVAPGPVRTEMNTQDTAATDAAVRDAMTQAIPLGRWGAPADVAHLVLALLDERADFTTAAVVPVDGGYLAR